MYISIYKCRMCGETFTETNLDEIELKYVFHKMSDVCFGFKNTRHVCKDGSIGYADFVGFKKEGQMEPKLIDGNAILKHFSVSENGTRYKLKDCDNFPSTINLEYVQKAIRNAPAIDPVHAAGACYCRECKSANLRDDMGTDFYECSQNGVTVFCNGGHFCSYGGMKQNETHR